MRTMVIYLQFLCTLTYMQRERERKKPFGQGDEMKRDKGGVGGNARFAHSGCSFVRSLHLNE